MGKIKNFLFNQRNTSGFTAVIILLIMSLTVSSCSAIGEIFKAGMSFGIFIVVAIIFIVVIVFLRFGKKKD